MAENLQQLKTRLDAATDGGKRLTLAAALLPPGDALALVRTMPGAMLVLDDAAIGFPDAATLEVGGRVAGPWSIPHIDGLTLADIDLRIAFRQGEAGGPITSAVAIRSATLTSGVLMAGSGQPDGTVRLGVAPDNRMIPTLPVSTVMAGITAGRQTDVVPAGLTRFDAVPFSGIDLRFGFAPEAATAIALTATVSGNWAIIDSGIFTLDDIGLTLRAIHRPSATGAPVVQSAATVRATTTIVSGTYDVAVALSGGDELELSVVPRDGRLLPALADLAAMIGGAALRSDVQRGIDLLGLGDISVDGITVRFAPAVRKLLGVELSGHFMLAGGEVDLSVTLWPEFGFGGGLSRRPDGTPPSGIALDALAQRVLGDAAGLPKLTVTDLAFSAYPDQGSYRISVTLSEDWTWEFDGSGPALTLRDVEFDAARTRAGVSGGLAVSFALGGFAIALSAQYRGAGAGWLLSGNGAESGSIPLGAFLSDVAAKFGIAIPDAITQAAGTFQLVSVTMALDTKIKAFALACDTRNSARMPFGAKAYALDLRLSFRSAIDPASGKRSFSGHIEGDLAIGKATFVLAYDFGDATVVRGSWREDGARLDFSDLAAALGIDAPSSVPAELDLGLKSASFEYRRADQSFTLSAQSTKFGDAFFVAAKGQSGKLGFVFGVDDPNALHLSDLPVIGKDLKAADFLTFKQIAFLVASDGFVNFSVPALPSLPGAPGPPPCMIVPGRPIRPIVPGATLQIAAGFSLVAVLDFAAAHDARARNLQSIVGGSQLVVQASIGSAGFSLYIALAGQVAIPGAGSSKLVLSSPMVRITFAGEVVFQLSGALNFVLDGTPISATASMIIDESEAQVTVNVAADHGVLAPPPGVKGLHFKQFGIEMGVFFEPSGLDLGLEGEVVIGPTPRPPDTFAIVLELIEEIPNPLYLSFYVDELDLGQIVTLFTNQAAPGVLHELSMVRGENLSFRRSEEPVLLPDGSVAKPGYAVSGTIRILSFSGHGDLAITLTDGVKGSLQLAPLHLGSVLSVTGDGQAITRNEQQTNGQWSAVSNNTIVRAVPPRSTRKTVVVPAGGPIIAVNCLQSPFLHVSLRVSLFDAVNESVEVTIATDGFAFALSFDVSGIEKFHLACTLKSYEDLSAHADMVMALDAEIGPIHVLGIDVGSLHLDTNASAAMAVTLTPQGFSLDLSGSFRVMGQGLTLPTVSLSAAPASLSELPAAVIARIREEADALFGGLFSDATRWAGMIGSGIVTGVSDVAGTLKHAFNITTDADAANLMKLAKVPVAAAITGLESAYGSTRHAAVKAVAGAHYALDDIASALNGLNVAGADAAGMLEGAGYTAQAIAPLLRNVFKLNDNNVLTRTLRSAGYGPDQIATGLKLGLAASDEQARYYLDAAHYTAAEIGSAIRSAYGDAPDRIARVFKDTYATVETAAQAIQAAFAGLPVAQAASALAGAGYAAGDAASALRRVFQASAADAGTMLRDGYHMIGAFYANAENVAGILRGAGYGADRIAQTLRDVFSVEDNSLVASSLGGAGFTVEEVAQGLHLDSGLGASADQVRDILAGANYLPGAIGQGISFAFGYGPEQLAQVFEETSAPAADAAYALQAAFPGGIVFFVPQVLAGAGYTASQGAAALHQVFNMSAHLVAQELVASWHANADVTAAALNAGGYSVDQVGNAVRDQFNLGADDLNSALQGAGFAAGQVKHFVGNLFPNWVHSITHIFNPGSWFRS